MPEHYIIEFQPLGKRVAADDQTTLFEAARNGGVAIATACGGLGRCGLCRVEIVAGNVTPLTEKEQLLLSRHRRPDGERLSCCVRPLGDVRVQIPQASNVAAQRLQLETHERVGVRRRAAMSADDCPCVEGSAHRFLVDSPVRRYHVRTERATAADPRADLQRLGAALAAQTGLEALRADAAVVRALSALVRTRGWDFDCCLRGDELVGVAAHPARMLGMAVDLGSTKIASYLLDLDSGEVLASAGAANPQIGYGEDVISRLTYVQRNEHGARTLASVVRRTLNTLLGALVAQAGCAREEVVDLCIVGNTAITHLLLELPVAQLASAPFVAADAGAIDLKARELDIEAAPGASVHVLPCVGGFVGADHVAMILATAIDESSHVVIGVDIGTNTEIVLNVPERKAMFSLSCPSGPAFEGAHISEGMRAAAGAIERVTMAGDGIECKTIADAPPVGLCGSGIVDAVAALRRAGVINARGRLQAGRPGVRSGACAPAFLLVPAAASGTGAEILVRQTDINEIQLAKGAIRAGIELILEHAGTPWEAVEEVVIAGAFGSYLDVESALDIGLFPWFENARYTQVGNAAARGAQIALLSGAERARARRIATAAGYLELTLIGDFNRRFAAATLLPDDQTLRRRHGAAAGADGVPPTDKQRNTA